MEVEGGNTSANDAVARKIPIQSRRAKGCPSSFCYFNSFSGFSAVIADLPILF